MSRWIVVVFMIVACSKSDPGPSCAQLTDHMLEVTKTMLPGHGDQPLGNRKQMIGDCEKRAYSHDTRVCILAAKTLDDLGACQKAEAPMRRTPGTGSSTP